MAKSSAIIDVLKQTLKSHGLTYAKVAKGLGISEASVKRMFSVKHFTLDRVDDICSLMDIDFVDLLHLFDQSQQRISHLSLEQEKELVADLKMLLVAVCARNHLTFDEIIQFYDISKAECIRCLARLDKLGLIELLPKNRIKLRIKEDFRWLPAGPIESFYEKTVQGDFIRSKFSKGHERRIFLTGLLGRNSQDVMLRKLDELTKEFAQLHKQDIGLPTEDKSNIGLVLAQRPWELSAFKSLHRQS